MRYLMICCLCLAVATVVFGQQPKSEGATNPSTSSQAPVKKPAPSLTMDDTVDPRVLNPTSPPKIEYTRDSYNRRAAKISYTSDDVKERRKELINFFLSEQRKDRPTDYCFCNKILASSLFAIRNWEILDEDHATAISIFKVRIDSSNKGGSHITVLWTIYTDTSPYSKDDLCISLMKK
jgi:hypothetical protein